MEPHPARRLWHALEGIHVVTYFAPACREAPATVGLRGFWPGYFAFRAAPLGAVGADVVVATFANFAPAFVARAVPAVWSATTPAAALAARSAAAADALRAAGVDAGALGRVAGHLEEVVAGLDVTGRPLAAANRAVALPDDPVERCWQLATVLREHRGDGHVAALVAAGLSGLEAHVLQQPRFGIDPAHLRAARGWSEEEWEAAASGLAARGIDGSALGPVEAATDEAAWSGGQSAADVESVVAGLGSSVAAVAATGWVTYPNPVGLPSSAAR